MRLPSSNNDAQTLNWKLESRIATSRVPRLVSPFHLPDLLCGFHEGLKIFPKLLEGDGVKDPAFDVVLISLPNYGFSEGPKQRGFAIEQYAEICNKLMLKLGYGEYVTQGGKQKTFFMGR